MKYNKHHDSKQTKLSFNPLAAAPVRMPFQSSALARLQASILLVEKERKKKLCFLKRNDLRLRLRLQPTCSAFFEIEMTTMTMTTKTATVEIIAASPTPTATTTEECRWAVSALPILLKRY